ncbi:D-tyrosyl-tRNA(Tyr) deacylase [Candidatus Woesearchaeota archaeon]|nr:D-tyrosyl-tRNA(Tyr) deacylase [Candidatus Woesearchaeota archaeon]
MMTDFAIITSSKDPAGTNIRNNLIEFSDFEKISEKFDGNGVYQNKNIKLYLTNEELVYSENIDKRIDADILIFASKHRSKENTPSFAVHAIGNWNEARLGGKEKILCPSSAVLLKNMFIELNENAKNSGYEITLEATHHGPYVEKPAVFVEIGSTEKEWNDKKNGEIIAKTIMNVIKNENKNYKIAIGIGGPHYCSNFNKIALRTGIALSHICPKYALQYLDEELINQAIKKTKEKVDFILLDWKGLGAEKQRIVEMLKNLHLEFKRTDQV